jgi:hypothetical protein
MRNHESGPRRDLRLADPARKITIGLVGAALALVASLAVFGPVSDRRAMEIAHRSDVRDAAATALAKARDARVEARASAAASTPAGASPQS